MNISVVLPAYKEADNLRDILPELHSVLKKMDVDYEILVIDTMTPCDDTEAVCAETGARYIPREGGNFYGDAIRTGIREAQGTYIVVMDADGSHAAGVIADFYREAAGNGYDLVIGSRYCEGGDSHNGFILQAMSRILNFSYRTLFSLDIKDVSDSFRMYRADQLKSISLQCDNFDIVEEILIRLSMRYKDMRIREIPIYFNKRVYGESKRDLLKFIVSYIKTMRRLWNIKQQEASGQFDN